MARSHVQNRLSDPGLSVGSIADHLACSADYLSHLFRTSTGLRLAEWINELRLDRAAELLATTSLSSKETGWACGFANQSYFIRLFRERYGASPIEYRDQL
jgi:transcriptional regulator GlxA family with amidase domain